MKSFAIFNSLLSIVRLIKSGRMKWGKSTALYEEHVGNNYGEEDR